MKSSHVYVACADSGDIHVLCLAADGELAPMQILEIGGNLMPMAQSPGGERLYVARRSEPLAVITMAIDANDGRLSKLGEAALPDSMAYIATDATGRFLFAASYPGDLITVSAVDANGRVGAVQQVIPTGRHAHCILAAPTNRHVLATCLGGGQLLRFGFNADTGALAANESAAWNAPEGAGPRHLRFHPNGRWVYLLNELDASVDRFTFDAETGTLRHHQSISSLPPGFAGEPWASDLHITPDGRYLFTSERRSSTLAAFAIDEASGALRLIGHTDTETQPRGFAITPDGRHLLAVGQASHHLSRYAINRATGALELRQRLPVGQNPNWIEIRP